MMKSATHSLPAAAVIAGILAATGVAAGADRCCPWQDAGWSWCASPPKRPPAKDATARRAAALRTIDEVEPNGTLSQAQVIDIRPAPIDGVDLDIRGRIGGTDPDPDRDLGASDEDLYRFSANKGDLIGLAAVSAGVLDPVAAIEQTSRIELIRSEDIAEYNPYGRWFFFYPFTYLYPPGSPMPRGSSYFDAALTWVAPATGDYLIRVSAAYAASSGEYVLQIRSRRPFLEDDAVGATQTIFLDFDGAQVPAGQLFESLYPIAFLSPLRTFLPDWGLNPEDEAAVIDAIVAQVIKNFDRLRLASLNGNRPTDRTDGHFDVRILNSKDHPDPFGQPNVSRVVVGGYIWELGLSTIGIAQSIDPGNYDRQETAVVLLDILSDDNPANPFSINSLRLGGGLTIIDAIGIVVGNIATHEAGHYLGLWHTDNTNDFPCIIDSGGPDDLRNIAGFGRDGILGTGDDIEVGFTPDEYAPYEEVAYGTEAVDVLTAFGLSTGRMVVPPSTTAPPAAGFPQASARATPLGGDAPLEVQFFAGGVTGNNDELAYTWYFDDGSDPVGGAFVSHVFLEPGVYDVRLVAGTSSLQAGEAVVTITVTGQSSPTVFSASPAFGAAPLQVTFEAGSWSGPGPTVAGYTWEFGDGTSGTGRTVSHTYAEPGVYTVRLVATTAEGLAGSSSRAVQVFPANASTDAAQFAPEPAPAAPLCGAGMPGAWIASLAGLAVLSLNRRR